jgi:hypothetical protein
MHLYPKGSIFWSTAEGPYYIHVVNKAMYAIQLQEFYAKNHTLNERWVVDFPLLPPCSNGSLKKKESHPLKLLAS